MEKQIIIKTKPFITYDLTLFTLATITLIITLTTVSDTIIKIFLTALTITIIAYTILIAQTITYYITQDKIVKEQATIIKTTKTIPKNKIISITTRQNPIQRIMHTATITIKTTNDVLELKNIKNPQQILETINKQ